MEFSFVFLIRFVNELDKARYCMLIVLKSMKLELKLRQFPSLTTLLSKMKGRYPFGGSRVKIRHFR